jgi:hypothetical protein
MVMRFRGHRAAMRSFQAVHAGKPANALREQDSAVCSGFALRALSERISECARCLERLDRPAVDCQGAHLVGVSSLRGVVRPGN